ncbi:MULTISPECIES: M64 family metallopeptidase [Sphingobacterium]|uniref:M64 family metallopeptidase n=1 Tax=Sphingobacterium TaxID=28453 RepID=UPI0013DCFCF5|nr:MULTISPECIES: M64 family metallopeptidase [unclassified Sphingobacterium]
MTLHKAVIKLVLVCTISLSYISAKAQQFDDHFIEKTLRLDYIFAGNSTDQHVYLADLVQLNRWDGRKGNLSTTPIQGNGQIKVYDAATDKLIYVLPFSSLFQEWLTQEESNQTTKSFENSYLIPYPKAKAKVQVSFFDAQHKETILSTHHIDPTDILIKKASKNDTPYEVIHSASVANPIKIAIVAEGYQEAEMSEFMDYAHKTVQSLFQHKIFKKHENSFEIVAVKSPSKDSNVSVPSKGLWRSTAVQSNFDTFYAERYLTTSHTKLLHNLLENIPYQHIIILANTDVYGGGGILNSYALTTTKNEQFAPVVVHEFGHSFAGLADEYFYAVDVFENKAVEKIEPWEKNNTSLADFQSKWADMISKNTPIPTPESLLGTVEIGAFEGLKGNGLYIPSHDCRMKANKPKDFCPVCSRAIEEIILFYTGDEA